METEEKSKRVLIAEDAGFMQRVLQSCFERAGFEVLQCEDGAEAVRLAQETTPSVIVMDILMPNMDGITALRELKNHPSTRNIPVIVLTAKGDESAKTEAQAAGAACFFPKPFSPTMLVEKALELVGQQEKTHQEG